MPNWLAEAFADPGIRTVRAVLVFFFHAITMAGVLICMKVVQLLVEILWEKHVMVFGQWDLEWLFQVIDVALIAVVGVFGVAEAITVYRRPVPVSERPSGGLDKVVDADFEEAPS